VYAAYLATQQDREGEGQLTCSVKLYTT